MSPAERELLRLNFLQQLDAVAPHSLRLPQLRNGARIGGFSPSDEQLLAELDYLLGKGLVATPPKAISPEIGQWKISATGRDHVAQCPIG